MYESYWQLNTKPFDSACDPRFYFPGESCQAALLKLRYAIENRRGAALLTGGSGTGKTLIIHMLRKMIDRSVDPLLHLVFPQMPCADLLAYLAHQWHGLPPKPSAGSPPKSSNGSPPEASNGSSTKALTGNPPEASTGRIEESIRRIERFLIDNTRQKRHAVVVVDEAHLLEDPHTLEALRLLLNFEADGRGALTLLLVGQPGLLPAMDRSPALEERLAVKCLLRPMSQPETVRYVEHRLRVAGAQRTMFQEDAIEALHELSHGVARRINRLADLALLIGYAEQQTVITAEGIESVDRELVTVVPE